MLIPIVDLIQIKLYPKNIDRRCFLKMFLDKTMARYLVISLVFELLFTFAIVSLKFEQHLIFLIITFKSL